MLEAGRVTFHRLPYDAARAAARVEALPVDPAVAAVVAHALRAARVAAQP